MVKNTTIDKMLQSLPQNSHVTENLCNIPAEQFGSLDFQLNPTPIYIKGVKSTYGALFKQFDQTKDKLERCRLFMEFMEQHYSYALHPENVAKKPGIKNKVGYLRLLRGWFFDTDGREAAIIKGWVESRFGLSPLYHKGMIQDDGELYDIYKEMRQNGSDRTNNFDQQLDLLYSFGQYQLRREKILKEIIPLYRGINGLNDFAKAKRIDKRNAIILLNNMNSFSSDRETAGQFGDIIMEIAVPKEKIFAFPGLLPNRFESESEFMVLGGVYKAQLSFM